MRLSINLIICFSLLFSPVVILAQSAINSSDLMNQVHLIKKQVHLISQEMGVPSDQRLLLQVDQVSPREEYFQALVLFRRANRLSFEFTNNEAPDITLPNKIISNKDILLLLNKSEQLLAAVMVNLKISEITPKPILKNATNEQVFSSLLQVNRQINGLLDKRFSPSDVYQQVMVALQYVNHMLSVFHQNDFSLYTTPMVRKKTPKEVYLNLYRSLLLLEKISSNSNIQMMKFTTHPESMKKITPSDVYEMASIIVSEVAYLKYLQGQNHFEPVYYYPGKKIPSQVYQKASLLYLQLAHLLKAVDKKPSWINVNKK